MDGCGSFRRLNLSPAGVSKSDLRRSVSSEDLLAGLTIRVRTAGRDEDRKKERERERQRDEVPAIGG